MDGYSISYAKRTSSGGPEKGRGSAGDARGGKGGIYLILGSMRVDRRMGSDFIIDTQISNRGQETKSEGGPILVDRAILWSFYY